MNPKSLNTALSKMLGEDISHAEYQTEQLQGGTVGNVQLISGTAKTAAGDELPFKIVLKIQHKWEGQGDPNRWRREYDLYTSELCESFSDTFRWPTCYHAEINGDETETQLWIQYIEGTTGGDLTSDMLETAAAEMGRYQGRLYAQKPGYLHNITNLGAVNAVENFYRHWKRKNVEYKYIREPGCQIPKHLCDMLIDIDNNADEIFARIRKLPVVFCHRDFWVANIIYRGGNIALLDWDTAGWGYLGEDAAQLITDETNPAHMDEYRRRIIPAYLKGFAEFADISGVDESAIRDMILIKEGYLCVFYYMNSNLAAGEFYPSIQTLQKLHDIFYVGEACGRPQTIGGFSQ